MPLPVKILLCALVVIILVWTFIALTIREFSHCSKPAACLLAPYLIWVSFATYLNTGYAVLNSPGKIRRTSIP